MRLFILTFLIFGSSPTWAAPNGPGGATLSARYFMTTFRLSGDAQLLLATSSDGATWQSSGNLYSDSRGMRDPSVIFTGGYYYVAYTILAFASPTSNPLIGIARSADLLNWIHYTDVSFAAAGNVQVVWAPEWFIDTDGSIHLLASPAINPYPGSHSYGHDLFEVHPTSSDMLSWSAPVHITGLPAPTSGPNEGNIDPFLVKKGGVYHLFFIRENLPYPLCLFKSDNLLGPYTPEKPLNTNWAGIGAGKEGECVTQMTDGSWRIHYSAGSGAEQLAWVASYDDWATWTNPTYVACAEYLNHGTISSPGANTADADGNGIPNLLQYALSSTRGFDMGQLPMASVGTNGRLALSFLRARSDVSYIIEGSYDLITWNTESNNPGTVGQRVTFSDTAPLTTQRRLLRLRVTDP